MPIKDYGSRRDKILELIIDSYINTAEPIASRTISRKMRLSLSPATVRNVMSDLEELGFIRHPHTSAGRMPTEKGYRYYIDKLMQAKLLTEEEKRQISREFKSRVQEVDGILAKASKILSSISSQTGIVLFPVWQRSVFKHIELIRLDESRILVILMTESGFTKDIIIGINGDVDDSQLTRISNLINSHIGKGPISRIRREIVQSLLAERDSFYYILEKAKAIIDLLLDIMKENKVYLDGRMHIAQQPEFEDIDKLKNLFGVLEDEDFLFSLLKRDLDEEGVRVHIGSEIDSDGFTECSLITCNYSIGERPCGTVGVIGPTRMEYPRLVSMVDYVASSLSKVLNEK